MILHEFSDMLMLLFDKTDCDLEPGNFLKLSGQKRFFITPNKLAEQVGSELVCAVLRSCKLATLFFVL